MRDTRLAFRLVSEASQNRLHGTWYIHRKVTVLHKVHVSNVRETYAIGILLGLYGGYCDQIQTKNVLLPVRHARETR